MNFLNIKNIHDNSLAQFKVGLVKNTAFKVKNDGSTISIEDDANSVSKLKVGGSAGFTISLVGDHIVFSANSGASPLCISEPSKGGIPGSIQRMEQFLDVHIFIVIRINIVVEEQEVQYEQDQLQLHYH